MINRALNKDFLITTIFILLISNGSPLFISTPQTIIPFFIALGVFIYKKIKIDYAIIVIVALWILINFMSVNFINIGQQYSVITIFSRLMRVLLVYLLIKIAGVNFFYHLHKYVYVLALIGIPLFLLQSVVPGAFAVLSGPLYQFTKPSYADEGSWYAFVYMYNTFHLSRNCGFMWEPGAFAGVMLLMLSFRLSINDFTIDKYVIVFVIAIITSISTAGYLALGIVIFAYLIKKGKKYVYLMVFIPFIVYGGLHYYKESDFLSGKVDVYLESGTDVWAEMENGVYRTSRLGIAIINFEESLHWPFGHGVVDHSNFKQSKYGKIVGPGSLSTLLHRWGWISIIVIFWALISFFRMRNDKLTAVLLSMSAGMMLFSNPDNFLFVNFAILFYVISFRKHFKKQEKTSLKFGVSDNIKLSESF